MIKYLSIWITMALSTASVYPQQNLDSFKKQTENYYHYLATPEIKNFTCKLSSGIYIDFMRDKADSTFYYPLKFVWTSGGNGYYVLQPLPETLSDSLKKEALKRTQLLKNLFAEILYDLQKFYIKAPFADIPADAAISFSEDTVGVSFTFTEKQQSVRMKDTYTRGGQLGRVSWAFGDQKIVNYPLFKEAAGKWICIGWNNQVYKGGEIISGMAVRMELARFEEKYLPTKFTVVAQQQKTPDEKVQTGGYTLFLKDYRFNEPIEELPNNQSVDANTVQRQ